MIARIHHDATIASFRSITIGTSMMTSTPKASVRMPENVGTKSSANAATMALRWSQSWRSYSS